MFKLLDKEEEQRKEQAIIEEDELGFCPDQDPQELMVDQRSDSAESDLSEGELGGAERMELFSDII